jgi:hypothetical protein
MVRPAAATEDVRPRSSSRSNPCALRRRTLVAVVLTAAALLASACTSDSDGSAPATTVNALDKTYPPQIALFGDSLAWEAQPYFDKLVEVTGQSVLNYQSAGGTAVCDWFDEMHVVADDYEPKAVELEFSGNALTPCMAGFVPGTDAYYAKYRDDLETAAAIFAPTGARLYLVSAPINRGQAESDPHWDRLNQLYAAVAAALPSHVTFVDAGRAVEGPDHTYTDTLPCLPVEPCDGPIVEGVAMNVVRAPDGGHFCPVHSANEDGVIEGCPVYSSGAFRYAYAMFSGIGVADVP